MNQLIEARSSIRPVESYRPPALSTETKLRQLMVERPLTGDERFGCYRIADSSHYSDVARAVECSVFQEFFGNDASIMTEAYAHYESQSTFLLMVDRVAQRPAGALRTIRHSQSGLKTLNDIERAPLYIPIEEALDYHGIDDLENCWDVGTLAVLKDYRGKATDHLVSTMLYGLLYAEFSRAGIEHLVTVLDRHAYSQLTEMLAVPFQPIAGSRPFSYLGSERSRAAYLHVPQLLPTVEAYMNGLDKPVLQLLRPYLARLIYGEGLPKVVDVS